jgi:NitT/TauT family transport system ATP-binding protein
VMSVPNSEFATTAPSRSDYAIEVECLHKSFVKNDSQVEVIRELSFRVSTSEFISLIGISGSGKSTLLRILAGLTPFQSGSVRVLNTPVVGPRADVGYVFQHLALLPWRTVIDNVLLPAELNGEKRRVARARALGVLETVGLRGYEEFYLREISGGMQQRVALARVLMSNSRLLLLDEPFSALDELTREGINMLFMEICSRTEAAGVLVTHSIIEAVLMSDRVLVMPSEPGVPLVDVEVDLPRPRATAVMKDSRFIRAVDDVRRVLGVGD